MWFTTQLILVHQFTSSIGERLEVRDGSFGGFLKEGCTSRFWKEGCWDLGFWLWRIICGLNRMKNYPTWISVQHSYFTQ
jgi:hypothetical protein